MLQTAVKNQLAFAAWRLPEQENFFVSISEKGQAIPENFQLEKAEPGFIFHPFDISTQNIPYFFKTGFLLSENGKTNTFSMQTLSEEVWYENFENDLAAALENPGLKADWFVAEGKINPATRLGFETLVKNGIEFLQKTEAEKIVPSRCAAKPLLPHFRPTDGFFNLTDRYPQAFVSLVSAPETGTWLGASPEILVLKNKQNMFRTMALAGTQKITAGQDAADAIWRQKEIEEQSLVVRYIISCFKKIRLREYVETGPRTVVAGNLLHLRSDFCVNLNEQDFPNLTSDMLHLLHPTSAVCGQPKDLALAFLNENENYNRRYYSGYLGPVNIENETAVYVNLRCLELRETEAILYAGAGVTTNSDPSKEWFETEMKMQTVAAALQIKSEPDDTATGY